jgi:hypothetical protein
MTREAKQFTQADLDQFTGSENCFRHGIDRRVLYTEGAQYLAEQAGAYWLLDEIAIVQPHKRRIAAEEFQVWTLKVKADASAILACGDGNGQTVYRKRIPFTDFPLPEVTLYFANNTIYLPSEH